MSFLGAGLFLCREVVLSDFIMVPFTHIEFMSAQSIEEGWAPLGINVKVINAYETLMAHIHFDTGAKLEVSVIKASFKKRLFGRKGRYVAGIAVGENSEPDLFVFSENQRTLWPMVLSVISGGSVPVYRSAYDALDAAARS